jgi:hypothetical protein
MPKTRIELISRPRSARRLHKIVLDEVEEALNELGEEMVGELQMNTNNWEHKPVFKFLAAADKPAWLLFVGYDAKTEAGQIYKWVDMGTGKWVPGGEEYDIFPVNAEVLHFFSPLPTKTVGASGVSGLGNFGIVLQNVAGEVMTNERYAAHVTHPGIEPRNFSKTLRDQYSDRTRPGGFRSTIEAAVKRAYRKMGVYA